MVMRLTRNQRREVIDLSDKALVFDRLIAFLSTTLRSIEVSLRNSYQSIFPIFCFFFNFLF